MKFKKSVKSFVYSTREEKCWPRSSRNALSNFAFHVGRQKRRESQYFSPRVFVSGFAFALPPSNFKFPRFNFTRTIRQTIGHNLISVSFPYGAALLFITLWQRLQTANCVHLRMASRPVIYFNGEYDPADKMDPLVCRLDPLQICDTVNFHTGID